MVTILSSLVTQSRLAKVVVFVVFLSRIKGVTYCGKCPLENICVCVQVSQKLFSKTLCQRKAYYIICAAFGNLSLIIIKLGTSSGLSLSFLSPVALIFTPVTNLLLCE